MMAHYFMREKEHAKGRVSCSIKAANKLLVSNESESEGKKKRKIGVLYHT